MTYMGYVQFLSFLKPGAYWNIDYSTYNISNAYCKMKHFNLKQFLSPTKPNGYATYDILLKNLKNNYCIGHGGQVHGSSTSNSGNGGLASVSIAGRPLLLRLRWPRVWGQ
jgi:putative hemolysin